MKIFERVTILNDNPEQNMFGTVVGHANYVVDDRDFTTSDGTGTMRLCYVVALDYPDQGWLGASDEDEERAGNGRSYITHLLVEEDLLQPAEWWVNVYELDRAYLGPEEGGRWGDCATIKETIKCDSEKAAKELAEELANGKWADEPGANVSSVVYNGGCYAIQVENKQGADEPPDYSPYE